MADLKKTASLMTDIISTLDEVLNEGNKPRQVGFMILMFNYNDPNNRANYGSNGVDRKEAVEMLRSVADRIETNDGMKHEN